MLEIIDLIQIDYYDRLKADGIPRDPSQRTPAQQATAVLEFWAAQNEIILDGATLTQQAVEAN